MRFFNHLPAVRKTGWYNSLSFRRTFSFDDRLIKLTLKTRSKSKTWLVIEKESFMKVKLQDFINETYVLSLLNKGRICHPTLSES